jgi:prepilin-type N-terminal cleavage/methylation domain-containing protein
VPSPALLLFHHPDTVHPFPLLFMQQHKAFTLLEVMLVLGIITFAAGITIPMFRDYQVRSDLNIAATQAGQGIGRAKLLSQSVKEDSSWGFHVPDGVLFKGETYATRDAAYDEVYAMPETITVEGLSEVSFSKLEGKPSATGSITLISLLGDEQTIDITVTSEGIPVNNTDKVTVCHNPGVSCNTLHISDSAWPSHRDHDDHLGACGSINDGC